MQNYKLTLCYDGTRYRGWQKQGNTAQTVQGKLETLLSRALEQPVEIAGSGRTDAGVRENAGVLLPGGYGQVLRGAFGAAPGISAGGYRRARARESAGTVPRSPFGGAENVYLPCLEQRCALRV